MVHPCNMWYEKKTLTYLSHSFPFPSQLETGVPTGPMLSFLPSPKLRHQREALCCHGYTKASPSTTQSHSFTNILNCDSSDWFAKESIAPLRTFMEKKMFLRPRWWRSAASLHFVLSKKTISCVGLGMKGFPCCKIWVFVQQSSAHAPLTSG